MDDSILAPVRQVSEHAVQILQNVVIGSVVGVGRMMVILRGLMRVFAFGKKRPPSYVMRALTANYWSHATDLRDDI